MPPKPASALSPNKSFSGMTMISLDDLAARILNQLTALHSEHTGRNSKNHNNNNSQHNDPNNINNSENSSQQTDGILTTLSLSYADGCAVSAIHRWIDWSTGEFSRNVIITLMRKNKIGKINKNVESSPQPQTISTLCSSIRVELFKLHTACSYRVGLQVAFSHAITVWIMTELRLLWSTFLVNDTSSSSKKKSKTSSQKSENNEKDHKSENQEKSSRSGSQTMAISCINATLVDFSRWFQRIVLGGSSMYDSAVVESVYESKRIILSECVASWVSHLVAQQQKKSKQRTELGQNTSSSVLPWHKQLLDVAIKPFLGIVVATSSSQQEVQQRGNSTTNGRRSNKIDNNNNNSSSLSAFTSPRELCDEICQKFGSAASLRQWENSLKKVIARKLETNNNNYSKNEGENLNSFLTKRANHQSTVIFGTPFVTSSPAGAPDKMFESLLFTLFNILSLKYNKISSSSTANRTTTTPSALVYFAKASLSTLVAACDSFLLFKNFGEQHSGSSTSSFYQNFIENQNSANTVSGNFLNKTMQLIQLVTSTNPFLEQEITQSLLINMDEDLSPRIANQVISRSRLLLRDCGILVGKNDLQQNGTANNNSHSLTISTQIRASIFKIVALISSIVNNNNNNISVTPTTKSSSTTSLSSSTFDFQSIRSYYKGENFGATLLGVDSSESHHYTSRPEHGAALAPASTLDTIIPGESDISLATFRISAALATIPLGSVKAIDVLRRMLVRRGMSMMSSSSSSSINNSNSNNNRNNNSAIISCAQLDSASVDVDHSGSDASSKGSGISSFSGSAADAQVPISFTTPYFLTNGNASNNINNTKKSQQQLNLHYLQSAAAANRLLDWVVVQVPSKSTLHCVLDTIGQTVPHFSDSRPALLRQAVSLLVSPAIPTETLAEYLTSSVLIASSSSINSLGSTRSFVLHVISSAAQAYSLTRLRRCIEVLILKVGFQFPLLTKEFARVIRDFSLINFYKFLSSNANNHISNSTSSEIAISKISAENLILALERRVSDVKPVDRDLGASLLRCARQALTHQATILKMLRAVQIPKMDNNGKNGYSFSQNHNHFLLAHQKLINAFSRRSHEVCLRLFRCIANRFEDILVSTEAMMMMSSLQLLDLTNAAEVSGVNPSGLPATLKSTSSSFLRTTAGAIEPVSNSNGNIIGKKSNSMIDDKEAAAGTQSIKKKMLGAFDWSLVEFSVKSYPIMTTATTRKSKIDDDDEDENNNQSEYHSASISSSSAFSPSHFISCGVQVEVKKAAVVVDSASSGLLDNDDDDDDDEEKYLQLVTVEVWSPRIPLLQSSKKNRHSKNRSNVKTRNSGDHDQISSNNNNNNKRILLESFTTLLNLKKLISNSKNQFTNVSMLSSPLKKQTPATITKTPTLKINIACNNLRLPFASSLSVSPFSPYEDYDGGIEELHLDAASNGDQEEEDGDDENNNNNKRTRATKGKKSSSNNNNSNSSLPTKTPKSSLQFIRSNNHRNNDSDQEDNDVDDENDSNDSDDGNEEKNVSIKKSSNNKNKNSEDESDDDGEGNDEENDDHGDDELERDPNGNVNDDDESNCDDDPENIFSAHHNNNNNNEEDFYNQHQNSSSSSSPLQPCDAPLIVIRLAHHQYSDNNNNPNSENDKTKNNNNNNNNHGSNNSTISVLPLSVSSALAWRNLISDEEQKLAFQMMKDNTDNNNLIVTSSIVALPLFDDDGDDNNEDNIENNNYNSNEASIPKHRKERVFRQIKNFFEKRHGIISSISNGSRCYSFVARARYPPVLVQVSIRNHDEEMTNDNTTNDEYGQEYLILNLKCVPLLEGLVAVSNNNNKNDFQQNGVDDHGEEQNHSVFRLEQKILHSLDAVEDAIVQGMKQ